MGEAKRREDLIMEQAKRLSGSSVILGVKIELLQDGGMNIATSVKDPSLIMLYGMLERAKDVFKASQKSNIVQIPQGVVPDQVLKGGNGG